MFFLQSAVTLYRVSDASGSLVVDVIGTKPLQQSMLKAEVKLSGLACHFHFVSLLQTTTTTTNPLSFPPKHNPNEL